MANPLLWPAAGLAAATRWRRQARAAVVEGARCGPLWATVDVVGVAALRGQAWVVCGEGIHESDDGVAVDVALKVEVVGTRPAAVGRKAQRKAELSFILLQANGLRKRRSGRQHLNWQWKLNVFAH